MGYFERHLTILDPTQHLNTVTFLLSRRKCPHRGTLLFQSYDSDPIASPNRPAQTSSAPPPATPNIFQPLDFLAELTQHIPNQGEHLVRYYGFYANKARGLRAKQAAADQTESDARQANPDQVQIIPKQAQRNRRHWAMLIKRIYQVDPLLCANCGGTMKIISFIEARQGNVIRKILEHCGLWQDPPSRAPPRLARSPRSVRSMPETDFASGITYEVDDAFLEHAHREDLDQPELPWEP